jgi:radical SAM protein with 4Fe4S-binding SPASM domain
MTRPRLLTLIVEVTTACDHACGHCYNVWHLPGAPPDIATAAPADLRPLLGRVLDQAECPHVTLSGGEPLLRDDLEDLVRFLVDRGSGVTLVTNGRRLSEGRVEGLVRAGVGLFELPLLSHRREVHDALSGREGSFDAVLAALADLMEHRGPAVTVFVATRRNIADFRDTLALAFAFGARGVIFNRVNPGGRGAARWDDLLPDLDAVKDALTAAEEASRQYGLAVSCGVPLMPCLLDLSACPSVSTGFCGAGTERAYHTLDTAGNVRPCNHTPTVLGNVWEEPLADILAPGRLSPFRAALPEICRACPRAAECQGGCKAAAQVCFGRLDLPEPFLRANLFRRRPF